MAPPTTAFLATAGLDPALRALHHEGPVSGEISERLLRLLVRFITRGLSGQNAIHCFDDGACNQRAGNAHSSPPECRDVYNADALYPARAQQPRTTNATRHYGDDLRPGAQSDLGPLPRRQCLPRGPASTLKKTTINKKPASVTVDGEYNGPCALDFDQFYSQAQLQSRVENTRALRLHFDKQFKEAARGFGRAAKLDPKTHIARSNHTAALTRHGALELAEAHYSGRSRSTALAPTKNSL
ncbi:MAG: hypothetical protein HRU17_00290 [Polyangiaceae bacterium]|nr:hypothetical protein [Polyangiaceae bacterium]